MFFLSTILSLWKRGWLWTRMFSKHTAWEKRYKIHWWPNRTLAAKNWIFAIYKNDTWGLFLLHFPLFHLDFTPISSQFHVNQSYTTHFKVRTNELDKLDKADSKKLPFEQVAQVDSHRPIQALIWLVQIMIELHIKCLRDVHRHIITTSVFTFNQQIKFMKSSISESSKR